MAPTESSRKSRAGSPLPEIPDKLYFRIGEVARLLVLPAYVLRFWESEFPQLKPGKGGTGQRLYRRRDLDTLLEIRRLLYDQGYTIPGARQFLKERAHPPQAQTAEEPGVVNAVLGTSDPAVAGTSDPATAVQPAGTAEKLLKLRSELREIASLLSRPATGLQPNNPAHRGLHLASKKRLSLESAPTLFAMRRDTPEGDPTE